MDSLLELFCDVDDFCKVFLPIWERQLLAGGLKQRQRARSLTVSEIMTILIAFHQSHYRDFKAYYCEHVVKQWCSEFPGLVSYKLFGDRGYISQALAQSLRRMFNLQLITRLRANMKNQLMLLSDRLLLRRRAIIETIIKPVIWN